MSATTAARAAAAAPPERRSLPRTRRVEGYGMGETVLDDLSPKFNFLRNG